MRFFFFTRSIPPQHPKTTTHLCCFGGCFPAAASAGTATDRPLLVPFSCPLPRLNYPFLTGSLFLSPDGLRYPPLFSSCTRGNSRRVCRNIEGTTRLPPPTGPPPSACRGVGLFFLSFLIASRLLPFPKGGFGTRGDSRGTPPNWMLFLSCT